MVIEKGKVVFFDYALKNEEGAIIDSSHNSNPLGYLHGYGNIITGLEEALLGKMIGDKLKVSIPAEKGYGRRDANLVQSLPRSQFDNNIEIKAGMQVQAQTDQGAQVFKVTAVNDETITLDGNHPLADMTLHFDLEIKEIRDGSSQELEQGYLQSQCCSSKSDCCD